MVGKERYNLLASSTYLILHPHPLFTTIQWVKLVLPAEPILLTSTLLMGALPGNAAEAGWSVIKFIDLTKLNNRSVRLKRSFQNVVTGFLCLLVQLFIFNPTLFSCFKFKFQFPIKCNQLYLNIRQHYRPKYKASTYMGMIFVFAINMSSSHSI